MAIVVCNLCGRTDRFYPQDFTDAIRTLKKQGWKVKVVDNETTHICPNCSKTSD